MDMSDAQLDDLKQFITATVSQSETNIKRGTVIELNSLRHELSEFKVETRENFAYIADLLTRHNDALDNHEARISKLESKAA